MYSVSSDSHIGTAGRRPQGSPVEQRDTKSLCISTWEWGKKSNNCYKKHKSTNHGLCF